MLVTSALSDSSGCQTPDGELDHRVPLCGVRHTLEGRLGYYATQYANWPYSLSAGSDGDDRTSSSVWRLARLSGGPGLRRLCRMECGSIGLIVLLYAVGGLLLADLTLLTLYALWFWQIFFWFILNTNSMFFTI